MVGNVIDEKKKQLLNMLNNNNFHNDYFIEKYSEYLDLVMEHDIPNVDIRLRHATKKEILFFIMAAINKGYINEQNKFKAFERLINSTRNMGICSGSYGICSKGRLDFNFNSSELRNNLRHYVCHELTHSITNIDEFQRGLGGTNSCGIYAHHDVSLDDRVKHDKDDKKKSIVVTLPNWDEPILSVEFLLFLSELMAESTACDLANSYDSGKTPIYGSSNYIKSDWHTPYNRTYQQMGSEFIDTFVFPDINANERALFKKLTLDAINDVDIGKKILEFAQRKSPNTYKEDLHKISSILGNVCTKTHSIFDTEVKALREIYEKYHRLIKIEKQAIQISHDPNYGRQTIQINHDPNYGRQTIQINHDPNRSRRH